MTGKAVAGSRDRWIRALLAGPGAIVVTIIMMAGMALWLPGGRAGIDNLVLPLVLAPLIWAVLFFHACLDRRIGRVTLVALALLLIHGGLLAHKFLDRPSATEMAGR
ncbi:hypothetical protein BV98_003345 [Sphingobium herbicidovorans NBRC 16415]|uniref:Uncharacterized protein n=1 Tax=Sphingobium herbicidovorans (strain ATCC 700291 / DSM 11019 / CCUG 56400 / KCTC 2939 / LMG 18315 / NBRC 16415 / MH) TaxID=1219045 RepID=A0A086P6C7_SPHHM|nr:hypothetical protein [Sphingobium herbicidovorans]KFG88945.1 hypothetical protein BV98_003345 [Sphingobium herbicidovorans NBRC 16415]